MINSYFVQMRMRWYSQLNIVSLSSVLLTGYLENVDIKLALVHTWRVGLDP